LIVNGDKHTQKKMFGSYKNMTKPQGATSTNTNKVLQGQQQQQAWKPFWQKEQVVQGRNPSLKHDPNAMEVDRVRWLLGQHH